MESANTVNASPTTTTCELPPLILHPFDDHGRSEIALETLDCDEQTRHTLVTRYSELRMLCLLGKDLDRWLGQCVECASRDPEMCAAEISESTFINDLLFDPPSSVVRKMHDWGVGNFQIIFSRALGLNTVFPHPPGPAAVSEPMLRNFHVYADALFDARLKMDPVVQTPFSFDFEIYASGEYSSLLERCWTRIPEA